MKTKEMKITKRSGQEVPFDITKIENAIRKASQAVDYKDALSEGRIKLIAEEVAGVCAARDRAMHVEEIQDVVETKLMEFGAREIAKRYIVYRYKQQLLRQANTTDKQILSLIECNNEDVKQENSNKNPTINAVQRDYMAGEVSKDVSARLLLPADVVQAHKEGITRAAASMQAASKLDGRKIFVIGNAPTALIELDRLHRDEGFDPDFIIGVPVGFVNVVYAKEQIIKSDIPYIVNRGRKGGSNIAACLVNAALYNVENRQL